MLTIETLGGQKDRIKAPGDRWPVGGLRRQRALPSRYYLIDIGHPAPSLPVRADPILMSGIRVGPHGSSHHAGMPLDKAGHQHRVAIAVVETEIAPGCRAIGI